MGRYERNGTPYYDEERDAHVNPKRKTSRAIEDILRDGSRD